MCYVYIHIYNVHNIIIHNKHYKDYYFIHIFYIFFIVLLSYIIILCLDEIIKLQLIVMIHR